jgi:hypothetical protein
MVNLLLTLLDSGLIVSAAVVAYCLPYVEYRPIDTRRFGRHSKIEWQNSWRFIFVF